MQHARVSEYRRIFGAAALTWAALAVVLAACGGGSRESLPHLDLSLREPLPAAAATGRAPLRVAVAAVLSPEGTIESYGDLLDYLGANLDRPVELIQRRTYAEVNALVAAGEVDVAFVCTSAYVAAHDRGEMELLAVPETSGESVYYSTLIVPVDSMAESIADLEGAVFAFTDPMSHTGRVYPTALVRQLGSTPESYFADTFFTYSHDRAIDAVASGLADGAAVDSLVLDYALARDESLVNRVKIIHRSPAFGVPPVTVPSSIDPDLRADLERLFFGLHRDGAGQSILARLGIDRFVPGDDGDYDGVREMVRFTGLAG